jgi:beta-mannosidase
MRRASQWLQYEGLRYAVEATLRRGAGTIPWQLNESYPNAWCTAAVDHRGDPKPAYWGVARAYRGAPSARFPTCAWGAREEVRVEVFGPARLVDLDGRVVAESAGEELAAPLDAFGGDVFVLDLEEGRNRYLMTRTVDLGPLLDLERAELDFVALSHKVVLRHVAGPAALGLVIGDARPYDAPGWATLSDNVLDLLPGEERVLDVTGPVGELRVEGWNARA